MRRGYIGGAIPKIGDIVVLDNLFGDTEDIIQELTNSVVGRTYTVTGINCNSSFCDTECYDIQVLESKAWIYSPAYRLVKRGVPVVFKGRVIRD
jgi:hypothetical protein